MAKPLPGATTPATIAAACLAAATFVPAVPTAAAVRGAATAAVLPAGSTGSLSLCQVMTNSLDTSSAWSFTVRPKGSKKVVARGLVPNGTRNFPACQTLALPPGAYTVTESQKKQQPVVEVVVRNAGGATKAFRPKRGKALTKVRVGVTEQARTTVTFSNRDA